MNKTHSDILQWKSKIPAFWFFAVPYCLLWAVLCLVFQTNFRSDVVEQYFMGDQWVISSGKNPILSSWYLNFVRFLTFDSEIAPYLAAESFVLVMLWSIWQLARDFLKDESLAFLAVVASANYRYLNIGNLVYANNIFLTVFWVLAILFLYRALMRGKAWDWILTGLWLGLSLHGKYTPFLLVFTMLVFMIFNRHARRYWKTPGPYSTTLTAFLVFLPHVVWLFRHDFHTFHYATVASAKRAVSWWQHLQFPLEFFFGLVLVLVPAVVTVIPLTGWVWRRKSRGTTRTDRNRETGSEISAPSDRFRLAFLETMIGLPLLLHLVVAALGRDLPTSYVMPLGMYAMVLLLFRLRLNTDPRALRRTALLGLVVAAATMIVWAGSISYRARFGSTPGIANFPGRELAEQVERIWTQHYGATPCPFVTDLNGYWLSGNVHAYGTKRIPVHEGYVTLRSTDEELNRRGGVILWNRNRFPEIDIESVRKRYPRVERFETLEIPYRAPFNPKFPPERIGIALISPHDPSGE